MNYSEAILQQTIAVQRKSDALLWRNRMNYEQFCEAIDEIIPSDAITDKMISVREINKALGQMIHQSTNNPYYEIYLSIKFNTPIK